MNRPATLPVSLALLAAAAGLLSAGPLNPPSGPITGTNKTLNEIEPRIPISSLPFEITQPGHYYLTGNLSTTSGSPAILLLTSNATIDLNGYTISGPGGAGVGISFSIAIDHDIRIRNGVIRNFAVGIAVNHDAVIEDMLFESINNAGSGIPGFAIRVADRATIRRVRIRDSETAFAIAGISGQVDDGGLIEDVNVHGGIALDGPGRTNLTIRNSTFTGLTGGLTLGDRAVVSGCSLRGAGLTVGANSRIENCCITASPADGIAAGDGSTVSGSSSNDNAGRGIALNNGGTVLNCSTRNNQSDGISVNFSCLVANNNCNGDGAATGFHGGIRVLGQSNRIDSNNVTYADIGIYLTAAGNLVTRNSLRGNTTNLSAGSGNDVGPTGPAATATSPWANILY